MNYENIFKKGEKSNKFLNDIENKRFVEVVKPFKPLKPNLC
jgi:hypothetical protein